nr:RhuM family protein [Geothermobacter hydrogeniphilus]
MTTAEDGKRYQTKHYNLHMILAVGYRVRSPRGTQFRQWATAHLAEYLVKGFVMDDERLKNPGGWDYFDELLARIREIRASEKRFYQKVRDLFALSSDYRADDRAAQLFFAETQNKLLFAVTGQTAAEIVVSREAMARIARERFDAFDENRRLVEARQADAEDIEELARIEKQLEHKKGGQ